MFNHKKLIVVAVVVLSAIVLAVPSWGAKFRKKINDEQFVEMCKKGDTKGVIEAINSGANINAKDYRGYTVLMLAADQGHTETVNALIEAGADDLTDNAGKTALIHAASSEYSNPETVNALIDAGSNVKQRDNIGKTAVDYARDNPKLKGTDALKRLEELSK